MIEILEAGAEGVRHKEMDTFLHFYLREKCHCAVVI